MLEKFGCEFPIITAANETDSPRHASKRDFTVPCPLIEVPRILVQQRRQNRSPEHDVGHPIGIHRAEALAIAFQRLADSLEYRPAWFIPARTAAPEY